MTGLDKFLMLLTTMPSERLSALQTLSGFALAGFTIFAILKISSGKK